MEKRLEQILEELAEQTAEEYRSTREYGLWKEKLDQMAQDCEAALREDEQEFVWECFDLLEEADWREACSLYRRGMRDGIFLLSRLSALG